MAFDANQEKMSTILSGDYKYIIPRYQRKYVWDEKQWRELLDDLKYCLEVSEENHSDNEWSHFLGSFVFEKESKSSKNLIVIDGQQRLTTIVVILSAICIIYNELGDQARFNGLTKYILGTDELGQIYARIDNPELSNFHLIIDESTKYNDNLINTHYEDNPFLSPSPSDNENIKKCFDFFLENFRDMLDVNKSKIESINNIRDKVLSLDVVEIIASNQQESYNIFEILNARGVDLKQHELIKNFIFKYYRPHTDIDAAKIKWTKFEDILYIDGRSVLDLFFSHYTTHKYEKPKNDNTEFRIFKTNCDKNSMEHLLDDLQSEAKIYRWFYMPDECKNIEIRKALQFFKENRHRQFRPVFMSVLSSLEKNKIKEKEAELFFRFMTNFYFGCGLVCEMKSNAFEDIIYKYANEINNPNANQKILELMDKLKLFYPKLPQFKDSFRKLGYSKKVKQYNTSSKKRVVQFILKGVETYRQSETGELNVSEFSIEHIANDNGDEAHCKIGNLLPLAEPINNNAGDLSFSEKLKLYSKSNFISVKTFLEYSNAKDKWQASDIDARSDIIAELAYNEIWKI